MLAAADDKKTDEAHMKPQDMPTDLKVIDNITYKHVGDQKLELMLFEPLTHPSGKSPLVVYIHGGGWTGGDRYKMIRPHLANVIRDLNYRGVTCASIEYRLAKQGKATVMESVADCKDALRFLVNNAEKFGFDPDRIALFGESAGGHLVLVTGLGDEKDYPCDHTILGPPAKVRCIVSYYPRTSFSDPSLLITERYNRENINKNMQQILGVTWDEDKNLLRKLSPLELVRQDSPPIQLVHGDKDETLPVSNSTAMRDAALAKGVPVDCIIVRGAAHCFDGKDIHPTDNEIEKSSVDFFTKYLIQSKPNTQ